MYRETHVLLDELADAIADGTRKEYMDSVATVPLLIIDDFGMRKLPHTAAEDLLEIIMRRYERFSTLLTSNRPVEDWGKLLGDVAAVSAMLGPPAASRARAKVRSAQLAHENRRTIMRNKALSLRGSCPRAPGIYRFPPEYAQRAAARRPSFRPLIGAPGRGRDEHYCPPPAQIRTSGITAYGSSLGYGRRSVRQDKDEECVGEESIVRR
jgi:hypothetical protein